MENHHHRRQAHGHEENRRLFGKIEVDVVGAEQAPVDRADPAEKRQRPQRQPHQKAQRNPQHARQGGHQQRRHVHGMAAPVYQQRAGRNQQRRVADEFQGEHQGSDQQRCERPHRAEDERGDGGIAQRRLAGNGDRSLDDARSQRGDHRSGDDGDGKMDEQQGFPAAFERLEQVAERDGSHR